MPVSSSDVAFESVNFALFHLVNFAGSNGSGGFLSDWFRDWRRFDPRSQRDGCWFLRLRNRFHRILCGELGGSRLAGGAARFLDRAEFLHALFALAAFAQLLGENLALAHWSTIAQFSSLFWLQAADALGRGET